MKNAKIKFLASHVANLATAELSKTQLTDTLANFNWR